ncbi:hypothetical protein, partial [Streptomyces sp. NPDC088748]|uniref:hypothetical protein n=1 Tax=Streptomyces sp. NPDC088748 TaxID=3365887 RepID=UPI0038087F3A
RSTNHFTSQTSRTNQNRGGLAPNTRNTTQTKTNKTPTGHNTRESLSESQYTPEKFTHSEKVSGLNAAGRISASSRTIAENHRIFSPLRVRFQRLAGDDLPKSAHAATPTDTPTGPAPDRLLSPRGQYSNITVSIPPKLAVRRDRQTSCATAGRAQKY